MGRDLESREDVPTPPSPKVAADFAHHDGDGVLHYPAAKRHHAQVVQVVYSEEPASSHPARVHSNIGQYCS